jgi:N-acetylmuramoyl-L-alanine amidase
MVRTLKALLLTLFCIGTLYGANTLSLIESADTLLKSKQKSNFIKARNKYKSAYLKAILEDQNALSSRALKGIKKAESKIKNFKKSNNTPKVTSNSSSKSEHYLKKYEAKGNKIILTFNHSLKAKDYKSFSLHKKNSYRQITDLKAILPFGKKEISSHYFKKAKLAQFNKTTARLVLEKSNNFTLTHKIKKNQLIITALLQNNTIPNIFAPSKRSLNTKNKLILIDAGHGGKDGGAVGYKKTIEKNIVLKVALELRNELKKRGYKTKMTRSTDKFIPLKNRTKIANKSNADLFISVHANSTASKKLSAKGIESYFLSPAKSERAKRVAATENKVDLKTMGGSSQKTFLNFLNRTKVIESNKFAIDIQKNLLSTLEDKYLHIKDNGVREAPFWVLVGAQMPAVLVEIGFITNPLEAKRMRTKQYQNTLAKGIANGIDSYFYHN